MALCIIQRLLFRVLCRWEILRGPDPWESGKAQAELRRDAVSEGGPVPIRVADVPQWHPRAREAMQDIWDKVQDPRRGQRGGCRWSSLIITIILTIANGTPTVIATDANASAIATRIETCQQQHKSISYITHILSTTSFKAYISNNTVNT